MILDVDIKNVIQKELIKVNYINARNVVLLDIARNIARNWIGMRTIIKNIVKDLRK